MSCNLQPWQDFVVHAFVFFPLGFPNAFSHIYVLLDKVWLVPLREQKILLCERQYIIILNKELYFNEQYPLFWLWIPSSTPNFVLNKLVKSHQLFSIMLSLSVCSDVQLMLIIFLQKVLHWRELWKYHDTPHIIRYASINKMLKLVALVVTENLKKKVKKVHSKQNLLGIVLWWLWL